MTINDAPLVVLGQSAGTFFEDFRGGVTPAGEFTGGLVVGEEATGDAVAIDGGAEVGDVVGETVVGPGEGGLQDDGGELGGGRRVVGEDRRREGDEAEEEAEDGCSEAGCERGGHSA